MFRQYMFVIFGVLSTMCFATSLLFTHRFPLLVKHMPQESDGTANFDNLALVIPQWRTRRAQPVIDYTDDFSADPFELLLSKCRPK